MLVEEEDKTKQASTGDGKQINLAEASGGGSQGSLVTLTEASGGEYQVKQTEASGGG